MEKLLLPNKIDYTVDKDNANKGIFTIEPCYFGYGMTLGNTLRRALLSSLPGAAVTSVKIKGVTHEFSTIAHIKEDVVEIILNLKALRLKVYSEESLILTLKVKGEKEVTAADITANSQVEVINKDLHLATLTDSKAELEMEITVNQGRGYVPTDQKNQVGQDVGTIAVDSIYTPIVNVGFEVSNTRVGQITNYDKLTLTVETDGTITPQEAFVQATDLLLDHFNLLRTKLQLKGEETVEKEEVVVETPAEEAEPAQSVEEVAEEIKKTIKERKKTRLH